MRYIFSGEYHIETFGDEVLLLPKVKGNYDLTRCVYLVGNAEELLKVLEKNRDTQDVYKIMVQKYPKDSEMIEEDMQQLIEILKKVNIVEEV